MIAKIVTVILLGLMIWFIASGVIAIVDNIRTRRRAAREDKKNERKENKPDV